MRELYLGMYFHQLSYASVINGKKDNLVDLHLSNGVHWQCDGESQLIASIRFFGEESRRGHDNNLSIISGLLTFLTKLVVVT